jgi:hypothetical protein
MKKKLLSEAQVRRFMGLAGINPLNEMGYHNEEKMENLYEEEDMEAAEEPVGDMEEPADEPAEADVEIDEEDLADVAQALETLQDKLAPLLDQAPEAGGEEPEMDLDAEEPEMDLDAEEPDMDMGGEEDELDAELQEVNMELDENEIVNEVARRVAKRIVEAKRAHKKMNEALGRKNRK